MFGQIQSESLVPRQFKFSKNINRDEQNQYLDKFIEIVDEREDSLIEEFQNYRYIYGLEKLKERQVTNEKLQKQIMQNNQKMKQRELIQGWKGKSKVSIKRFSSLKSKLNVNKSENQKMVQFLQQEESQKEKNQNEKYNEKDNQENQGKKINSLPILNQKTRSSTIIKNCENKQNQQIQQNLGLKKKKSVQTEEEKKQAAFEDYQLQVNHFNYLRNQKLNGGKKQMKKYRSVTENKWNNIQEFDSPRTIIKKSESKINEIQDTCLQIQKKMKQDNYEEKKDKNFQLYEKLNNLLKNLKNRNEERLKKILKGNRSQLNDKGILEAEFQIAKYERKNYVAQFIKTIKGIYDKNRDHNFSVDENQHNSQSQSQQYQQQSGNLKFESGEKSVQERKIKNFNYFEIFLKTLDDMEKSLEARKDLEGYLEQIDQKKDFSSIQEISKMQNDIFIEYRDNREKLKEFVYEIVKEFEDFQYNNQKFYEDLDKQLNRKKIKQQKLKDLKKLFARKIEESRKLEEFKKFCKNQEIQKDQLNKSINEKQMDYFQTDWIYFENDRFYHYLAKYNEGESYIVDDKQLDQQTNDLFNSANTNQKQQTSKLKSEGKNSSNRSLNEAIQNQNFKTSQNQIENGNFTKRNSRVQFIEISNSKDYLQENGQQQYQQLNKNQQQNQQSYDNQYIKFQNQEQMNESQNQAQQQQIKKYNYMGNMRNKQKSKSIDMGQYENQQKQLDILKEQLEIYLKEQKQQEIFEKMKLQDSIKNNNQSQSQKIKKRLDFNLKNTVVSFYKHSSEKIKRAQNKNKEQNITDFGSHNFLKSTIKSRERKKFNQDEVFQIVQSNKGNIDRVQFLQKINDIKNDCEVLTENEIFKPAKRINNLYKNAYYQQNQNEFKQKAQVFKRGTDLDLKQDQYLYGVEQMVKINEKMDKNSDSNEQSEIYETPTNKLNSRKKRNYTISFSDKKMDQLYNGQKMSIYQKNIKKNEILQQQQLQQKQKQEELQGKIYNQKEFLLYQKQLQQQSYEQNFNASSYSIYQKTIQSGLLNESNLNLSIKNNVNENKLRSNSSYTSSGILKKQSGIRFQKMPKIDQIYDLENSQKNSQKNSSFGYKNQSKQGKLEELQEQLQKQQQQSQNFSQISQSGNKKMFFQKKNGNKLVEKQLDLDEIRLGTCISLDKIDNKAQKMLKSSSNYSVFKESINQYRSHALWLQEYYKLNQNLKDKYGDRLETYQQDQVQKQIKTEKNTQMLNYLQKVLVPISEEQRQQQSKKLLSQELFANKDGKNGEFVKNHYMQRLNKMKKMEVKTINPDTVIQNMVDIYEKKKD